MWRALIGFWCLLLGVAAIGGVVLQILGPPAAASAKTASSTAVPATAVAAVVAQLVKPRPAAEPAVVAAEAAAAPLPAVAPAMRDTDQRAPGEAFAASFDTNDTRPRIALLIAGVGMNAAESAVAIATLPAEVSLAMTPYAARLDEQAADAHQHGHEVFTSIPMEPQGYPLNDPGNRALLTGASMADNAQMLDWVLSRVTGTIGATGALGELRGERFAAADDEMAPLLDTLAERRLLYIDPRPNATMSPALHPKSGGYRGVNVVIDDPGGADAIDRALARLELVAHDRGSALGLAGRPSPMTIDRITAWATGLAARGIALAPASVVVQMPQAPPPLIRTSLLP